LFAAFIFGVGIYILIRRLMVAWGKRKSKEHSIAHFEKLNEELASKYERERKLNNKLTSLIHNFEDKFVAFEAALSQGKVRPEDLQNLRKDWRDERDKIKEEKILTSTRVNAIDNLFAEYAKRFSNDNIDFNLSVQGNVKYMIQNIISSGSLETLILNHLNNAQIAINKGDNTVRCIMVIIGVKNEKFELEILDGGIPFKVSTLEQLGTRRITTHANTGGSGIGFETTFEIMEEIGASLIINENPPSENGYTKSISIRFDNKKGYVIETYRPDEFAKSDRYYVREC